MKRMAGVLAAGAVWMGTVAAGWGTPSTHIWIPSTDIQPAGVWHVGVDNYFRVAARDDGTRDPNILDAGLTVGVLPTDRVKAEIGVDYLTNGTEYDDHPWYFNAKVGIPEGAFHAAPSSWLSPALAVGVFNVGTRGGGHGAVRTDQNIVYGEVAQTVPAMGGLPSLGRFTVGWYSGNDDVLAGADGEEAASGILASWDRVLGGISDKLWVAVDYMGGGNMNSGLSLGASWAFSRNVSLLVGYSIWDEPSLAGENTVTCQLDVNFP